MDFDGSRGNVRDRYEAFENVRRMDALAKRERAEAGAVRDRLERGLPVGERANLGNIVAMAAVDSVANRSSQRDARCAPPVGARGPRVGCRGIDSRDREDAGRFLGRPGH